MLQIAQQAPVGFRAPGYDMSERVLDVLMAQGYRYDSSVFPSWPYYLAKAGVMAMMSLVGRPSRSVLGDPRALFAPTDALSAGRSPFARGQSTLVELPVATTPGLRMPAIGSWAPYVSLLSRRRRCGRACSSRCASAPFSTSSCTGSISSAPRRTASPPSWWRKQPDLRVSLVHKQRALEATLDRLALDYHFAPLCDVAAEVQREGAVA